MDEVIRIDEEQGYLDLQVKGSMSTAEMHSQVKRVTEMATEAGIRRVLINNVELEELPPAGALYEIVSVLPQDFRYAIVAPLDLLAAESMRFVETASMNTGLAVRIFKTREAALEWLLA